MMFNEKDRDKEKKIKDSALSKKNAEDWCRLDLWTYQNAAFLVNGLDPNFLKKNGILNDFYYCFTDIEHINMPPLTYPIENKKEKIKKIYDFFDRKAWEKLYDGTHFFDAHKKQIRQGLHPFLLIHELIKSKYFVPKKIFLPLEERLINETKKNFSEVNLVSFNTPKVQENTLLKILGVVVKIYLQKNKTNQTALINSILEMNLETKGLSKRNLEKYISLAVNEIADTQKKS